MATGQKAKRSTQAEKRRNEVASLYLSGHTQANLATRFGVSHVTIYNDLKIIRGQWLKSALRDFDRLKSEELAKVDRLENEYWEAWRRSLKQKTTKLTEKKKEDIPLIEGKSAQKTIERAMVKQEESAGDPRFLDGIHRCISQRCKILGLEAPFRAVFTQQYKPADIERMVGSIDEGKLNEFMAYLLSGGDPEKYDYVRAEA